MNSNNTISTEEKKALEHVKYKREFYGHLFAYVVSLLLIFAVNLMTSPQYLWAMWVLIGWGVGIMSHGTTLIVKYGFFVPSLGNSSVEKTF